MAIAQQSSAPIDVEELPDVFFVEESGLDADRGGEGGGCCLTLPACGPV